MEIKEEAWHADAGTGQGRLALFWQGLARRLVWGIFGVSLLWLDRTVELPLSWSTWRVCSPLVFPSCSPSS